MVILFGPSVSKDITCKLRVQVLMALVCRLTYSGADYSVSIHLWTILEATTLIIAACLPSIWPLVRDAFRRLKSGKPDPSEKAPATRLGLPDRSIVVAAWAERQLDDDLETLSLPPTANPSPENSPAVAARETF